MRVVSVVVLVLIAIVLYAQEIKPKKSITVLTRNAPMTFYYGVNNQRHGLDYEMIEAFAAARGYSVKYIVKYSIDELLEALKNGEGDFAAAGLTDTQERRESFLMGPHYYDVQEQVVCGNGKNPRNIKELLDYKVEVIKKSSYLETIKNLKKDFPALNWAEHAGYTTEHIFERIDQGFIECTIADSHVIAINRRYYPRINVSFAVSEIKHLAWMFPKKSTSSSLQKEVVQWFETFKESKRFVAIKDSYFSHVEIFDYVDISTFHERIKNVLPKYLKMFQDAAHRHHIDWRFLAAQAYQESHWNAEATSPTGVRGIMMLTLPTAEQMGVADRLDPEQSIEGGAKYMARQIKYVSKYVKGRFDRIKFALAGYNVGRAHVYDAIALGKKLGKNPYVWVNMKKLLPLLAQRNYFKDLKYGYARGHEPVQYVTRINNYFDILCKYYP